MAFFTKSFFLLSLILSAAPLSVLASPHAARGILSHHHRHVAARVAAPADVPSASTPRKRATGKRCRPRSSSIAAPAPKTTKPVANVAPTPDILPVPATTQKVPPKEPEPEPKTTTKVDTPSPSPEKVPTQAPPPPSPSPSPEKVPTKAPSPPPSPSPSPEKSTTSNSPPPVIKPTPKPTPTPAPAPPPSNNNSGGGARPFGDFFAGTQVGEGTFYATGLTACGETNNDSDFICAVSQRLFDIVPGASGNPNNNPICGKKVRATYKGNSVTVRITDRCVSCAPTDLDFSPAAFKELAPFAVGRLQGVTWTFV